MEPTVYSSNRGFSLIELLIAMVIMMVGLLGLLQTVNVALLHNMTNQMRNEAVIVADEQMVLELTKPFDLISSNGTPNPNRSVVQRNIYNGFKNYSITKTGTTVTNETKSVLIAVRWRSKDQSYSHSVSSLISKYKQ